MVGGVGGGGGVKVQERKGKGRKEKVENYIKNGTKRLKTYIFGL